MQTHAGEDVEGPHDDAQTSTFQRSSVIGSISFPLRDVAFGLLVGTLGSCLGYSFGGSLISGIAATYLHPFIRPESQLGWFNPYEPTISFTKGPEGSQSAGEEDSEEDDDDNFKNRSGDDTEDFEDDGPERGTESPESGEEQERV